MICPDETEKEVGLLESLLDIFHVNKVSSISWIFQPTMNMSTLSEVCATMIQDMCDIVVDDTRIQSAGLLIEMTRCHLDQQSRALDACVVHNNTTIVLDHGGTHLRQGGHVHCGLKYPRDAADFIVMEDDEQAFQHSAYRQGFVRTNHTQENLHT